MNSINLGQKNMNSSWFNQGQGSLDDLTFTQSANNFLGDPNVVYANTNPSMLINNFGGNVIPSFVPNSYPM